MRNYRIILKQNNLSAWGGGRSQIFSPIRDSIKFIAPLKLKLNDNIGLNFSDSISNNKSKMKFTLEDENKSILGDENLYEQH